MKILITAGGTIEPIDNVRSITNTGTGRLGSLIADEFLINDTVEELFYVCTTNTLKPCDENIKVVNIRSVSDLEKNIIEILRNNKIDIIVHSMAVSDFTVRSVSDMGTLVDVFKDYIEKNGHDLTEAEQHLLDGFDSNNLIGNKGKMSSKVRYPMILLDETPKVLPMLRKLSPDSVIVGFKLLSNVPEKELLDIAYKLLISNKCDFVFANDESQIDRDRHAGFLLNEKKESISFCTKQEIAVGLVKATLDKFKCE